MKTSVKRIICVILSLIMLMQLGIAAFAADPDSVDALKEKFKDGVGPEVDGLSVDYVYYAPENTAGEKLPLVLYFHGKDQGGKPRDQIDINNFPLWASDEIQQRFTGGGAYLFVPRSHEERNEYWSDEYVPAVKAALDDFIAQHADTIDMTRIYVGGFSMGGKMTLKTASSYPDFFAAAFPMCPAYNPSDEQLEAIADIPVWLLVSRFDIIAGYYTYSEDIWNRLCEKTNVPEECRLTLFGTVKYPNGKKTLSNHYVWFALANDMFTYDEGKYPNAVTTDATGKEIELISPDGVVSWLCAHTSDYSGGETQMNGTLAENPEGDYIKPVLKALFPLVSDGIKTVFYDIIDFFKNIGK